VDGPHRLQRCALLPAPGEQGVPSQALHEQVFEEPVKAILGATLTLTGGL